ncbi:MAG: hypothetical protein V3U13_07170 [Gemmatimonadota bacterium]
MKKVVRLAISLLVLAITPAAVFAQAGETPLMLGPEALAPKQIEFRGYITIEDDWDLFGVYRQGIGGEMDFGVRAGYSDFAGGGFTTGGDIRWQMSWGQGSQLKYAVVAGLQLTFGDRANKFSAPFGVSLGADVGTEERAVLVYGLPRLTVERTDPDAGDAKTDLEFGIELGAEINLTRQLIFDGALVIATNDGDNIVLALGIIYRR